MTRRDRVLLVCLVPVLVLGGVWFLLLSPMRKEAQELDTRLAAEQQRLSTAEGDVIRFRAAREEVDRALRDLAATGRAVPADDAVPALLRQLERASDRAGVTMQAVQTGSGTVAGTATAAAGSASGATSSNLTLTFEGRYLPLQRLLAALDRAVRVSQSRIDATGRLLSVSDLQLVREDGGLVAQVQASVYVLPDLATLVPAAPGAVPDPAIADPAAVPGSSLATATPVTP